MKSVLKLDGIQPLFDKSIIDEENTTAEYTVGNPVKKETVFVADKPWEKGMAHYCNVIKDGDKYKMYYITHFATNNKAEKSGEQKGTTIVILDLYVCYAESIDGINWVKPNLGLYEYEGSYDNNIILRSIDKPEEGGFFDNFFVFIDENPACPKEKRYKATAYMNLYKLGGYSSADGIHWNLEGIFDLEGKFDTLNVCWWDKEIGKYVAYVRDFHDIPENGDINAGIRDARRTESEDFIHWTKPELIKFNGTEDYPIYTNNITRYYRNPNIYIGFPTRYEERKEWSDNFEQLCGKENRLKVMEQARRYGLTITDCVFMSSRDGINFDKCDEALFTPNMEFEPNWIYGNCYMAYFMLETPVGDGENTELSLFVMQHYAHGSAGETGYKDVVERYTVRRDGFAYYKAKYSGAKVITKPFIFDGSELYLNFSTSAKGSVYITIKDEEGNTAKTCELFGDSDKRKVKLLDAEIKDFARKPVIMEFKMKDAKVFSFEFK